MPPTRPPAGSMIYTSGTTGKPKGALRTTTDPGTVFALLGELGLRFGEEVHLTTGPLYHSGPLAFASLAHTMASPVVVLRKFDADRVAAARRRAPRHQHVLGAHAAEADREPAARGAGARRRLVDALPRRERRARAVRAQGRDRREARRLVPLRGLRVDRARHRDRAEARGPAAQAGIVRDDLRTDRGAHRPRRRHRGRHRRARRAVHPHRRWRWTATTAPPSS